MPAFHRFALLTAFAMTAASCVSPPFSYAENRCTGGYNRCSNACESIKDAPAASACFDRCLSQESQCGDTGADAESLSESRSIGAAQTQSQKEAGYQEWLRKRARESRSPADDSK